MTTPLWVLLAFAGWTLLALFVTVGTYRWSRILTGRAQIAEFRADQVEGTDFYKRSMRAHANCVENLPVYASIVVVATAAGIESATLDTLALVLLGARVVHTSVHLGFVQSNPVAGVRFAFYFVQVVCMIGMGIHVAAAAWPP